MSLLHVWVIPLQLQNLAKFFKKVYGYEIFIIENICNIENLLIICMFWILLVQIFFKSKWFF